MSDFYNDYNQYSADETILPSAYIYHPQDPVSVSPRVFKSGDTYSVNLVIKVGDVDGGSAKEKVQIISVDGSYPSRHEASEIAIFQANQLVNFIIDVRHGQELSFNLPDDFDEMGGIPIPVG